MDADVIIVGGGIAGAGAAFEIASFASVIVLERESRCGVHATGRSAASFTENYGPAIVRALAKASRGFLEYPPAGFTAHPILTPRGMLTIARRDQLQDLERDVARAAGQGTVLHRVDWASALARVPILRPDYGAAALLEPGSMEIDVEALHQGFLRGAQARGARLMVDAGALQIAREGERWCVTTPAGVIRAATLISAAGAWGDEVARAAGVRPIGLIPKRRTAFHVPAPPGLDMRGWPLVNDIGDAFYFKRDAGQIFVSPSDATPSPPLDAMPDDLNVAIGVERLETATTLTVGRRPQAWAGLRTFAPDASPVVGPDPQVPSFFWLAGQGGTGIKTAPALSRACASLLQQGRLPDDLSRLGLLAADLAPDRFRAAEPRSLVTETPA